MMKNIKKENHEVQNAIKGLYDYITTENDISIIDEQVEGQAYGRSVVFSTRQYVYYPCYAMIQMEIDVVYSDDVHISTWDKIAMSCGDKCTCSNTKCPINIYLSYPFNDSNVNFISINSSHYVSIYSSTDDKNDRAANVLNKEAYLPVWPGISADDLIKMFNNYLSQLQYDYKIRRMQSKGELDYSFFVSESSDDDSDEFHFSSK